MLGYSGNIDQDESVVSFCSINSVEHVKKGGRELPVLIMSSTYFQERGEVPPPHLVVVSPGHYIPEKMCFDIPEHDAWDKLLPKGHQYCKCEEYKLGKHIIL